MIREKLVPLENSWLSQLFKSKAVKNGGIIRRKVSDVEKNASEYQLQRCVKERGFHLVKSGNQYVVFCVKGPFKQLC